MTEDHQIELPIEFEAGSGTTHSISPEEVWFTTRHALDVGQRIGGTLCFSPVLDGLATELRFAARVAVVAPSLEDDDAFEVWARFERIELRPIAVVGHQNGCNTELSRKFENNHKSPPERLGGLPGTARNRLRLCLETMFKRAHTARGVVLASSSASSSSAWRSRPW